MQSNFITKQQCQKVEAILIAKEMEILGGVASCITASVLPTF
jgi:hypothetical protein